LEFQTTAMQRTHSIVSRAHNSPPSTSPLALIVTAGCRNMPCRRRLPVALPLLAHPTPPLPPLAGQPTGIEGKFLINLIDLD
jgi:hypothetical protein